MQGQGHVDERGQRPLVRGITRHPMKMGVTSSAAKVRRTPDTICQFKEIHSGHHLQSFFSIFEFN